MINMNTKLIFIQMYNSYNNYINLKMSQSVLQSN